VTQGRNKIATSAVAVSLVLALVLSPRVAFSSDGAEVEELRREVRQLQMQLQSLRSAMSEIAELDRQRAAILSRVAKNGGGSVSEAPPPAKVEAPPARTVSAPPPPPSRADTAAIASRKTAGNTAAAKAEAAVAAGEGGAGTIRGKVAVPSGEPVAYVYVENIIAPPVKGQRVSIEQVGKKFVPAWAVVQRGTTISFPNKDNIYHNVFSLSSGNTFDLGLYNAGAEAKTHTFMEPGAVDIYCNIHPQMAASALVVPNRYFAKVKGDGSFEIPSVPAGRRKVVAWSPGSRLTAEWVEVTGTHPADLSLKLEAKSAGHKNKSGQTYGSYE
jgi:plastocyanin